MIIPPGFDRNIAVECADLVLRAYDQYAEWKPEPHPDPLQFAVGKVNGVDYQTRAVLVAHPTEGDQAGDKEPFGFVAQNLDSGDVFVTFRGTDTFLDWVANLSIVQAPVAGWGRAQEGFHFIYYGQCKDSVRAALAQVEGRQVYTTGHSLGAAIAVLATADIVDAGLTPRMYSFAGPRAVDLDFAQALRKVKTCWRIVNTEDLVPTVPLATPELGVGEAGSVGAEALKLLLLDRLQKLVYTHAGESVPFTVQRNTIVDNHDMKMYRGMIAAAQQTT